MTVCGAKGMTKDGKRINVQLLWRHGAARTAPTIHSGTMPAAAAMAPAAAPHLHEELGVLNGSLKVVPRRHALQHELQQQSKGWLHYLWPRLHSYWPTSKSAQQ
jgi:hypothetical protein